MNTSTAILLLVLGAAGGYPLGRWQAERARLKYDLSKLRQGAAAYRKKK